MISSCATPDIAMLRWIAHIKSLNLETWHVVGKHNVVANMLSRARYNNVEDSRSNEENIVLDFFTFSCAQMLTIFKEGDYKREFIEIGKYLSSLNKDESRMGEDFRQTQKKAYKYFLKDGYLWKHPKKRKGAPLRVVCKKEEQHTLIVKFHNSAWARHQGKSETSAKLKERYWWLGFYKDVTNYVETCKE